MILAMALAPAHRFLASRMGGRSKLASVFIVSVCLVLIIVPSWLFLDAIIDNVKDAKASFQAGTLTIPPPSEKVKSWPIVGAKLYGLWQLASVDLRDLVVKYKTQLLGLGGTVARGILSFGGGAFQLIIAIFIAGALLATRGTGESVHRIFGKLAGDKGDELAAIIHKTVGKVVKGILGVAFIQSLMIGVGLLLSGVPYAGIWTLVVFLLAVLQIPQFLVVIPAAIYLFSVKSTTVAVLWTIFLMIGGLADNVLKPILLGKGAPVPMLVIFIGVIGGFLLSGLIGLFTGAIVMSVGYTLFQAWLDGDVGAKPV
jgi:predicted PurR-regulated permease PerM